MEKVKPVWVPTEYVSRQEYLKLYQKYRYHNDEDYRAKQMKKVKERYKLKCISKQFKNNSEQDL
jgi:hypothetical protein